MRNLKVLKTIVRKEHKSHSKKINIELDIIEDIRSKSLIVEETKSHMQNDNKSEISKTQHEVPLILEEHVEAEDNFFIYKRVEICKLASKLKGLPFCMIMISLILYLYIAVTASALILGNSLDKLISREFNLENKHDSVGGIYYVSIICFYFLIINISTKNIEDLKKFTLIIMIARIIVICLLFMSMIYIINKYGMSDFSHSPKFDFSNSALMFGNTLFYFMIQHSIPGVIEGFAPQRSLLKLLFISFAFSFIVFYSYGLLSFLAFGKYTSCDLDEFPSAINAYFNLNFMNIRIIGDIINYYPLFNIITCSIQMITLKNNILIILHSCLPSIVKKYNEARNSNDMHSYCFTLLFSFISIFPSIVVSLLMTNIQSLMKYFTSVFGFF